MNIVDSVHTKWNGICSGQFGKLPVEWMSNTFSKSIRNKTLIYNIELSLGSLTRWFGIPMHTFSSSSNRLFCAKCLCAKSMSKYGNTSDYKLKDSLSIYSQAFLPLQGEPALSFPEYNESGWTFLSVTCTTTSPSADAPTTLQSGPVLNTQKTVWFDAVSQCGKLV